MTTVFEQPITAETSSKSESDYQSLKHPAMAAEQRRCEAMLRLELKTLASLLDDRLTFCHATGSLDNKEAYLKKIAEGKIAYRSIQWFNPTIIELSDTAILTGKMLTRVVVAGAEKTLNNQVISVWKQTENTNPYVWKLIAFQSTPILI